LYNQLTNRRGKVFFWIYVFILAVISCYAIYIALYLKIDLGILIATAIAAVTYPLFVLAERYVWTPDLEILYDPQGDPDQYRPTLTLVNLQTGQAPPLRVFIRVGVNNKGGRTAKSCVGEIKLQPNGRPKGCTGFSGEPKILLWTRFIDLIDILPKQTTTLEVAFAQDGLSVPFRGSCVYQGQPPHVKAWASTSSAIKAPNIRLQDGFCEGQFKVKVMVYSENADPVTREFLLNVGVDWQQLTMQAV